MHGSDPLRVRVVAAFRAPSFPGHSSGSQIQHRTSHSSHRVFSTSRHHPDLTNLHATTPTTPDISMHHHISWLQLPPTGVARPTVTLSPASWDRVYTKPYTGPILSNQLPNSHQGHTPSRPPLTEPPQTRAAQVLLMTSSPHVSQKLTAALRPPFPEEGEAALGITNTG